MNETYEDYLNIIGYTEERFVKDVVNSHKVKHENKEIKLKKSHIHGIGCFTTKFYSKDSLIGKVLNNNYKTELGRYVNHSSEPNVYFKDDKFFALKDIEKNTELLVNYITNLKTLTKQMESNLITQRENKIDNLLTNLIDIADGVNIIGDGKKTVREAESLEIIDEFTEGVYMRRMDVKKDTLIVGAIHKELHSWFLMHGTVKVADAENVNYFKAPYYTISQPGTQRVIEVVEDAIWVNIHSNPDNKKDIDIIEKRLFALNRDEYKDYLKQKTKT